jgi:hypothetical protein
VRDCATLEEQRAVYKQYAGRIRGLAGLMNATRRLWCPFIAVPANQLHLFDGNIALVAAENLFLNTHIAKDNYHYYGYLYGCYTAECCPRYLKRENWEALQRAVDHIDVQTGTLKEVAGRYPDAYFSRYILLDHMDWMPMEMILDEWAVFVRKARPDVRFLWRSFADHQHIAPLKYLTFHEENVRAALAMLPDRVAMYNSTHLATLPGNVVVTPRTAFAPRASLCDDANVLFHNWLHPISGGSHQERLESFYRGQAQSYDAFRHRFLHGRVPMIEAMPTLSGAVWVDLGGGTAANLEHFRAEDGATLGEIFSRVVVVDLCRPLIDVAAARVEANGWSKTVELVVGDATDPALRGLPAAGSVDLVTMSYSLTMIPDWQAALRNVSVCVCGRAGEADGRRGEAAHARVRPRLGVCVSPRAHARPPCARPALPPPLSPRRRTACSSRAVTSPSATLPSRRSTAGSRARSGPPCLPPTACAPTRSTSPRCGACSRRCTAPSRRAASRMCRCSRRRSTTSWGKSRRPTRKSAAAGGYSSNGVRGARPGWAGGTRARARPRTQRALGPRRRRVRGARGVGATSDGRTDDDTREP